MKHSYSVSDYFAVEGSDGTGYTELNVAYPVPISQLTGLNVALHVGHLNYENYSAGSYTDYLVGGNKDFTIAGSTGYNVGINYSYADLDLRMPDRYNQGGSHVMAYLNALSNSSV